MARLNYGEETANRLHVHYIVEAVWPEGKFGQPGVPDPEHERWGRYNSTAWNDRDRPNTRRDGFRRVSGNFDDMHRDVAAHPSRVGKVKYDAPVFTDPQAALAYAARLQAQGEVAARFSDGGTQADRDDQYQGRVIKTRVVEQYYRKRERVVLP
jgi:hypothetical protein